MKIIVDAMGGDNAPLEIVRGTLNAAAADPERELVLVGREGDILSAAKTCGSERLPENLTVVNATEVIEIADDAATAFKKKKDSSITVGLTMLKNGEADAFVSAGSTGALLSAGTLIVKRVRGIRRAAMAPFIPTASGGAVLIDCGANAQCTEEYLIQFAYLGSFYAEHCLGIKNPRVGLLNIGAEDEKGDQLRKDTVKALREAASDGSLNFIGSIEAKEAIKGGCDVIVADGFSGNVMLKTMEGTGSFLGHRLKDMFLSSFRTKLAALLLGKDLKAFKEQLDPDRVGGTPFLGLTKPIIKAHGSSGAAAIESAIDQAAISVRADVASKIAENIDLMRVESPLEKAKREG